MEGGQTKRPCINCTARVSADRSVCGACGALQPLPPGPTLQPRTISLTEGSQTTKPPAVASPPNPEPQPNPEPNPEPVLDPETQPEATFQVDPDIWTTAPDPEPDLDQGQPLDTALSEDEPVAVPVINDDDLADGSPSLASDLAIATETSDDWDDSSSPKPWKAFVAVGLVIALAIGAISLLGNDGAKNNNAEQLATMAPTTTAAVGKDPQSRIRSFCAEPRALGNDIAPFVPGDIAVGYSPIPNPSSTTGEPTETLIGVSPKAGQPKEVLDSSLALASVGICLAGNEAERTGASCSYQLTNSDNLGEQAESKLLEVTYDATIYSLRDGKKLTSGTIASNSSACPDLAFTDGEGVSNPISPQDLAEWVAVQMPGGKPLQN